MQQHYGMHCLSSFFGVNILQSSWHSALETKLTKAGKERTDFDHAVNGEIAISHCIRTNDCLYI